MTTGNVKFCRMKEIFNQIDGVELRDVKGGKNGTLHFKMARLEVEEDIKKRIAGTGLENELNTIISIIDRTKTPQERYLSTLKDFGRDRGRMEQGKQNDDLLWERVRAVGHFYDKLEIMPGAKEMFNALWEKYGNRCEILSGIPKPKRGIDSAGADKINWIQRLLSKDIVINIVYREDKPDYCTGKDCILIDDYEKNIHDWVDMGGTGILNKNASETIDIMKDMGIL